MAQKLVISYSDDDRDIALKIRDQLTEAGYDVWIAHLDIRGSVDWAQSIVGAIDNCHGLVLVWSESAAKSENVREEIRLARVFLKPVFPILAHPMARVPSLPVEIQTLQVIQNGDFDANVAELKARLTDPKRSNIRYVDLVEKVFIPKARNPYFVGRNRELKDLFVDSRGYQRTTRKDLPIAISGLAGIGKTQLALTFGYRFNSFFPDGVYWVDAPNGIVHEFSKVGPHLGVNRHEDERPYDYAIRVLEKLNQLRDGLIIFDNITDLAEFRQWCPQGSKSCFVILTTRMSPRGFPARVMNLTELDSDSAYEMLLARRKDGEEISRDAIQREALKELCRITGNHPLALELCASRLQSEFIKPFAYLKEIQSDPLGRLSGENTSKVFLDAGDANLAEVLHHSYASLDMKLVDRYFLLMCCFAPYGINEDLIIQAYGDPGEGGRALDQLSNFSFIRRELLDTLSLHPLVAQFGRGLQKHRNFDYPGKFLEVMLGFLRAHDRALASEEVRREKPQLDEALRVADDNRLWDAGSQLYEYDAVLEAGIQEQIESLNRAYQIIEQYLPLQKRRLPGLRLRLGKAHRTAGRLHEALADLNQAELLYREIGDMDPAEEASLRFELGDIYLSMGRYADAETILSQALERTKTHLDNSAPEVLQLRQALARLAFYRGDYGKADANLKEILKDRSKFYATRPDATSAAWLASADADLSRLALARAQYTAATQAANAALAKTQEYHEECDPECSHLFLLLGTIYYESGEYGPAEEQLDKARQNFLMTFGGRHPNYARTLVALGDVHRKQGQFDKAETEVKQAIDIFESVYGASHPSVAEALAVQAKIYDHQCKFDDEVNAWERVLKIQHKFYSEQHPALADIHYDYSSLFLRKGEYDKAAEQVQASLKITEHNFGTTHADYFGSLVRLAICRYEQQQYVDAQKIINDAKDLQKAVFGDAPHPYIARLLQLQSEILRRQGKFTEALDVIDQAIAMKKVLYGTEKHPSVAEALEMKIKIFHHRGERIEAKLLIERTLDIRLKAYGENHPEVSRSLHDLGSYYLRLGQYEEAAKQFEKARRIIEKVFGTGHPDYIERTLNLANARNKQGEYQEALNLVASVADALPTENHYLTARWLQLMGELQRRIGQFDTALGYIDQAIEMKKAIYGTETHPSVAEALEVRAKIYDHQCKFDEEENVWKQVLEIQLKFYSEQHPVLATTYYDYASLFMRQGEYDKAAGHLEASLKITEHNFGKTHTDYFGRLVRLATCRYEQQQYLEAQRILKEATNLRDAIFGTLAHPYIARLLQLQSEILRQQGKFTEALDIIDQAITMKKVLYSTEEHPSVAESLAVRAKIYDHQCKFDEEENVWKRVLEIQHKFYSAQHPVLATTYYDYASLFLRRGEYDKAAGHLEASLKITEHNFGKTHTDYFGRLIRLATCRYEQQEYLEAQKILDEATGLRDAIFGTSSHPYIARLLQLQSEILRQQGKFTEALDVIDQAIKMKKTIYGTEDHPSVSEALAVQAKIHDHQCKFDEEQKIWEQVLEIQHKFYSEQHPVLATTHYDYASLFMRQGEYDKAAGHLEASLKITEHNFGKTHTDYFGRMVRLATCRYEQQQYLEAQKILDEAKRLQKSIFGDAPHPYIARLLQLQSEILRQQGKFTEALDVIDQAIAMKKTLYSTEEHPSVAEALEVKVDLALTQLSIEESSEILDKIERIRSKSYGKHHPEYANYQMRRAEWYSIAGQYNAASDILEQSLRICLSAYSAEHPETLKRQIMLARMDRMANKMGSAEDRISIVCKTLGTRLETEDSLIVAETFQELSNIRRVMGDYTAALAELEKATRIETKIFGPESPKVIELHCEKAKPLILLRRLTEADEILGNALQHTELDQPIFKRLRSNLLEQRGILQDYKREYDRAIESINEAIQLKKDLLINENVESARLYVEKAVVLRHQGKYTEALASLEKALNIDNLFHLNENHVYFARILLEQGQTYLEKRSVLAAQEHLKEALKIYDLQPSRNSKQHADASEALGRNCLENGLLRDASIRFQEAMDIRTALYGNSHPEIAQTLYYQAQTLLKMLEVGENGVSKVKAREKLNQALHMLRQRGDDHADLINEIACMLETL